MRSTTSQDFTNHRKRVPRILLAIALFIGGGIAGMLITHHGLLGDQKAVEVVPILHAAASQRTPSSQITLETGFGPIVKKALPAVVNISTTKEIRRREAPDLPFFFDPFFREFFGGPFGFEGRQRVTSLGSGVIVSPEGYILTNHHVIEDADEITVYTSEKREWKAEIVGSDPKTDLAVLKVKEKNLPVLPLADSDQVEVGDIVLAIGNPFGLSQTVTMGIVSATGRADVGVADYEDFIQTDAAINPGNSGGALINIRGELIGINTAIATGGGRGNVGIGFAIPSNMAKAVMEQIIKHGRVIRGWLGVTIQDVDQVIAKQFGLKEPRGVLVADVARNSPAAQAGFRRGDIILEFNGEPVKDTYHLRSKVALTAPGTVVKVKIFRDGKEEVLTVKLGELPEEEARRGARRGSTTPGALSGVEVDDLTPQLARRLGLPPDTFGVVVINVAPGSPAAEAGLRRGDVIMEVNRRPVANVQTFYQALKEAGDGPVLLLVNRGGNTFYVVVRP